MEDYFSRLKKEGIKIYTTALKDTSKWVYDVTFANKMALVIGNEGSGVSDYCLEHTDEAVMIPMPGEAESLNASVATAVCMYEIIRKK